MYNYKHRHRVEWFKPTEDFFITDPLLMATLQHREDEIKKWLKVNLVKGQDWSPSDEAKFFVKNIFTPGWIMTTTKPAISEACIFPCYYCFLKEEDAMLFRLKFGL